jgi:hypothetical protein
MKYKGYELLKAIADGEIKEGSLILFDSIIWIVDEYSDIVKYKEEHITLFNTYKAKEIAMSDFELIENKIDIDSIGELKSVTNNIHETICMMSKINELVQAVKQINKEVKEMENKMNGNDNGFTKNRNKEKQRQNNVREYQRKFLNKKTKRGK